MITSPPEDQKKRGKYLCIFFYPKQTAPPWLAVLAEERALSGVDFAAEAKAAFLVARVEDVHGRVRAALDGGVAARSAARADRP